MHLRLTRRHALAAASLALGVLMLTGACRSEQYTARLASGDSVQFVRAIKGNDLVVKKAGGFARLRLVGVYTFDPNVREKNDIAVWANNAAEFAAHLGEKGPLKVVLELDELDPRGRHLGFLEVDGTDVGRELIEQGHGAVYTEYPFSRESAYFAAESPARVGVRGIWGGVAAKKRLLALRETWSAVRGREAGTPLLDPLLAAERR